MHIVFIISSLKCGGAEKILSCLANYCASCNYKVSIITLDSERANPFYFIDQKIHLIQLNQLKNENNYIKRLKNNITRVLLLRTTIKKLHPDVIISFTVIMNIITLIASIKLICPIIVVERTDPYSHNISKFYNWLRMCLYPFAFRVAVQTEGAAKYFYNKCKHIITIIPNFIVKPSTCKNITNKDTINVITIGRLSAEKGHKYLIKAFAILVNDYSNLNLIIYGEGDERRYLENMISELNLQNKVKLPGVIKDTEAVLITADLFVFPSLYEGFPNALCEAMAVGLPVIASDCSGNKDIIQDGMNGKLFPVGDVEALANIMRSLINDAKERERLSVNARKITETFSEEKIYNIWTDLIYSVSSES